MTAEPAPAPPVVVVVGALNVDLVVVAPRLPAPGETVVGGGLQVFGGGKGANAAVAARAGASVRLVAAVGADDNGARALDELRAEGIDTTGVIVLGDQPTGVALIVVDEAGENQIALGPGANGALSPTQVTAALTAALDGAGCVVVSTEIPGPAVVAAAEAARDAGVPLILNPAPVNPAVVEVLALGPLVTPNATELDQLAALCGLDAASGNVEAQLAALVALTGTAAVVTRGADGALVARPDGTATAVAAHPVAVVDTTGAGDTFNGWLAARLAAGVGLAAAVADAALAASLSVTVAGARSGMPVPADLATART